MIPVEGSAASLLLQLNKAQTKEALKLTFLNALQTACFVILTVSGDFQNMDFLQGKSLLQKGGELVSAEAALKKKILILFYFTSLDSEACRIFDVKLKAVYQEAVIRKVELGVIVVSSDANPDSFMNNIRNNYLEWYSVPFNDELIQILIYNFGITHVPSLIVVTKSGTIVSREGVKDVEKIGINVLVTWTE